MELGKITVLGETRWQQKQKTCIQETDHWPQGATRAHSGLLWQWQPREPAGEAACCHKRAQLMRGWLLLGQVGQAGAWHNCVCGLVRQHPPNGVGVALLWCHLWHSPPHMWARWQRHLPKWPGKFGCAWCRPRGRQKVGILWVSLAHSTISATDWACILRAMNLLWASSQMP